MNSNSYQSWGRVSRPSQSAVRLISRSAPLPLSDDPDVTHLPFGNGRSYGDSCHNEGGILLDCRDLDQLISFDTQTGILRAEAGMLLSAVLAESVPKGWFLPVTPGTQFVTLGGAIANDVHGKNHHKRGTFGCHIRAFELMRSDGSRRLCTPGENVDYFRATIGGMGLTGLVTWAELQLMPIGSVEIEQETIRFDTLDEFFALAMEADARCEYTVAWIDATARGSASGRGLFMRGNHAAGPSARRPRAPRRLVAVPFAPPMSLVNRMSARAFNTLYFHKAKRGCTSSRVHYAPFFYPLDAVGGWNKVYGPRGFMQHQSVIPTANARGGVEALLREASRSGCGSFLSVLKVFGGVPSPGLVSFPRAGATLTFDFAHGAASLRLLERLDHITVAAGGAVNPYKDVRMSSATFQASFPGWRQLLPYVDPRFSSSFWRRVSG